MKGRKLKNQETNSTAIHPSPSMAMMIPPILCLILSLLLSLPTLHAAEPGPGPGPGPGPSPSPTPWPLQFHATLVMDYHGNLSLADLWYDWPGGRNLHVIRYQLAAATPFYDIEWNNGTSFFYTRGLPPAHRSCRAARVGVGILRPDWLVDGAAYLGRRAADGFDCHAWAKADFITYYEDARTKRPVKWVFYTGRTAHVMSFEEGAVLADDTEWQAPDYCFLEHDEAAAMIVNYDQSPDPKEDSLRGLVGWI